MTDPPIRLDPAARFDDEIARIAKEHDADVVFRLTERKAEPVADRCALDHDGPVYRIIGRLEIPDHDAKIDVPLCEEHAFSFYAHDPKAFDRAPGTDERKAEFRCYAEESRSAMRQPRLPKRDREPNEIERSLGLQRDTSIDLDLDL